MMAACAIAERAARSSSAYGERNREGTMRTSAVEFFGRHWILNANETLESDSDVRWLDSRSNGNSTLGYDQVLSTVKPSWVNAIEANHGRKRKMVESAEEDWFRKKYIRVGNGNDRCSDETMMRNNEVNQSATAVQNSVSFHSEQAASQSMVNHCSIITLSGNTSSSVSCNEEASRRSTSSAKTSSHIPRQLETCQKLEETDGRFMRTSERGSFHMDENEPRRNLSPVKWWTNSANSPNFGFWNIPAEMLRDPRNAIPFQPLCGDIEVNAGSGSLPSSEPIQSTFQAVKTSPKSRSVLSDVTPVLWQILSSKNNNETSASSILLRNAAFPPHPFTIRNVDEATAHNSASESRQPSSPSKNGTSGLIYVTNPDNSLNQILVLLPSDLRESNADILHKSLYECSTSLHSLERPEERQSEERLWRNLEASCKQDLPGSVKGRSERSGFIRDDLFSKNHSVGFTDYTFQPGSSSSGNIYNGYNVRDHDCFAVVVPSGRVTVQKEMPQRQHRTQEFSSTTATYKRQAAKNQVFHSTDMLIRNRSFERARLISVDRRPPFWSQEKHNRWTDFQRENLKKLVHRSKSLSPSVKSSVCSGNFGSLQSIRAYCKTLGKTRPSFPPKTGTESGEEQAKGSSDAQQFVESSAGGIAMPIDLSSAVRKREQNVSDGEAMADSATDGFIDCVGRRNTELLGGYVLETRHARSSAPGGMLSAPNGSSLDSGGVDISDSFSSLPSPSVSLPSSRLSSPVGIPDSHLPPKKRRMPNYLSTVVESPSSKVPASPALSQPSACSRTTASVEESFQLETKAQVVKATGQPERSEDCHPWPDNGLESPEDVRWVVTPDEDGDLPLHIGVARGSESYVRKCVGMMLRLGASLDVYDSNRKTALQIAVITTQPNIVKLLVRASASPNVCDRNGANSLHLAVKYDELECLKCLLTQTHHVLDLDARNYEGLTALHLAVMSNRLDAARILLLAGASVNIADGKTGQTPLHYAADRNSHQMAELLMVYGATPSVTSYSGCTPAQVASAKSHLEMAKTLGRSTFNLSHGPGTTRRNLLVKEQ